MHEVDAPEPWEVTTEVRTVGGRDDRKHLIKVKLKKVKPEG